jgi:hypothetical protein
MPAFQKLVGSRGRKLQRARGRTLAELAGNPKAYGAALPKPHFKTALGAAYCGKAEELLPALPDESVNLIFTSPPYALHFKKDYGNVDQDKYVDWFLGFASEFRRVLKPDGSLVINIGGRGTTTPTATTSPAVRRRKSSPTRPASRFNSPSSS